MQDLTVIGIENGSLLVSSETGERYRVAIDEVLQSRLRQSTTSVQSGVKVSPREIQAQIRAGMSAEDVARSTGATLEYVERFEGPVVAERLHIVSSALKVPVKVASAVDPLRGDPMTDDQSSTFGDVIEERLDGLGATDLRWASWKEESGWIVKLTFTASEIDHDARWQYDPKRHALAPLNTGAVTLSQHGEISDGLIPRLRAVDLSGQGGAHRGEQGGAQRGDTGLNVFDDVESDAAGAGGASEADAGSGVAPVLTEATPFARTTQESSPAAARAAVKRAVPPPPVQNETADLLEALRRRRGERESASFLDDGFDSSEADTAPVGRLVAFDQGAGAPGAGASATGSAATGSLWARAAGAGTAGAAASGAAGGDASDVPLEGLESVGEAEAGDDGRDANRTGADAGSAEHDGAAGRGAASAGPSRGSSIFERAAQQRQTGPQSRTKRRTAMPSWDEIVFGARSDDDLN